MVLSVMLCSVVKELVGGILEPIPLHLHQVVSFVVVLCHNDARLLETTTSHHHGDDDEQHDDEHTAAQPHDDRERKRGTLRRFDLRLDGFDVAIQSFERLPGLAVVHFWLLHVFFDNIRHRLHWDHLFAHWFRFDGEWRLLR